METAAPTLSLTIISNQTCKLKRIVHKQTQLIMHCQIHSILLIQFLFCFLLCVWVFFLCCCIIALKACFIADLIGRLCRRIMEDSSLSDP